MLKLNNKPVMSLEPIRIDNLYKHELREIEEEEDERKKTKDIYKNKTIIKKEKKEQKKFFAELNELTKEQLIGHIIKIEATYKNSLNPIKPQTIKSGKLFNSINNDDTELYDYIINRLSGTTLIGRIFNHFIHNKILNKEQYNELRKQHKTPYKVLISN